MSQIDAHYDHAIIGSGISGLLCAAYLAKKGKKVIVLEKNHQIGGCLQVFSRDKKIFDTGVHYVGSLGKGQPLRQLFDFIGIGDLLKYQRLDMDGFDRIYFEDEQIEYKFGQGWDNFISGLSKYFPEESENLVLLVEEIKRIVSLFGPYHLKELEENSVTIEILSLSAYEVISSFITSERLIAVLWGNSILYAGNKAKTPFYVFALILNSYVEGSYRLIQGGSQISKYLSMIIHDNGGLVRKYAEVTSIEIEEGKVDKVIVDQNISVNVSTCIAAIHPACVIGLLPEYSLRPSYVSRVKELQNTPAFISVYFSLKENALPYFNYNTYILKNNDAAMHPDGHFDDNWPTNMMISTGCEEHDQQYANTINVLAYCDVKIFKKWENTFNTTARHQERGQDYDQLKEKLINKIAKKVASKINGFEDMYFAAYCSTPLTYRDFLNVPDGTGYGVERDYNNALFTYISPKMKIPNLLMTGQNTDLHGVYGASISALLTLKHTSEGKLIFTMNIKKIIKITFKIFLIILGLIVVFLIGFFIYLNSLLISNPEFADNYQKQPGTYTQLDDSTRIFGNNSLRKLQDGFYEMYVEGEPFERGNAIGILTSDLHEYQEDAFINQIKKMIPGEFYLKFLKYFVAFFNRDIEEHIPKEYLEEIYGESLHMNSKYDNIIGSPYMRILNYHAAHDIGHALQDKNFVAGCTSFAAWGSYTEDGNLLVGRNFDFYVGDEFAKNKIVAFINPDKGIPFGMVTWPGMIGVVSGINKEQITITINAAKSAYPTEAKTPVSILAREILQYAHNLDEAIKIAGKFDLFVSESLLVASGKENKAIIIEKSPEKMDVFAVNDSILYCSNHFQSKAFSADSNNIKFKNESSSNKRFTRLKELVINNPLLNPSKIASILRDPYGPQGKEIGWGNEDAINQLIAHHGVIFKPSENEMWISTAPFQLGKFIRFDLDEIFNQKARIRNSKFDIPADDELIKVANKPYQEFRKQVSLVRTSTDKNLKKNILKMNNINPQFYLGYEVAGDYYSKNEMIDSALISYKRALKCDIPLKKDSLNIINKLSKLNNK